MKKKVGLITIYHVPNYGSVLQAFATQIVIEDLGYECIMLNYKYPNEYHYNIEPQRRNVPLKSKIAYFWGLSRGQRLKKKLEKFKKDFFNFSDQYDSLQSLKNYNWSDYSAFVVGSDQVWNSRFTLGDSVFLLSFVPDSIRKISYASSFASKSIPDKYKALFQNKLTRFDALSVREKNGVTICSSLNVNKLVKVVLDPTLLLCASRWKTLLPQTQVTHKNKYILLYLLTYAFEPRPYVFHLLKYFQEKYSYEVIALAGYSSPKSALGIRMINKTDADVSTFLNLFEHAELVVTTSFHGTAFAVNFGRPLCSIVPADSGDDRQSSLLQSLGLDQCILKINQPFEQVDPFYDVSKSQEKLDNLRKDSISWFKQNL